MGCRKVPKSDFPSQFSMSNSFESFWFFFIEKHQFKRKFFVIVIFWKLLYHFVFYSGAQFLTVSITMSFENCIPIFLQQSLKCIEFYCKFSVVACTESCAREWIMRRQIKLRSLTGVKIFFMSKFFTSQVENSVKNLCHTLHSCALTLFCHE